MSDSMPGSDISWCDSPAEAETLAQFFAANLTLEYISHSELQGPRARAPGLWSDDIVAVLTRDFVQRSGVAHGAPPAGEATKHAIAARHGGRLAGIAMLTFSRQAEVPYGVIEDIVVSQDSRGQKLGSDMMAWIFNAFRSAGLKRAFLESGGHNSDAHAFFGRWGFREISIVMMAGIDGENTPADG